MKNDEKKIFLIFKCIILCTYPVCLFGLLEYLGLHLNNFYSKNKQTRIVRNLLHDFFVPIYITQVSVDLIKSRVKTA